MIRSIYLFDHLILSIRGLCCQLMYNIVHEGLAFLLICSLFIGVCSFAEYLLQGIRHKFELFCI